MYSSKLQIREQVIPAHLRADVTRRTPEYRYRYGFEFNGNRLSHKTGAKYEITIAASWLLDSGEASRNSSNKFGSS